MKKRVLTILLAPLIVFMLMSFTPQTNQQDDKVSSKDSSSVVSVKFSPAKLVVEDNRSVSLFTDVVLENAKSNSNVAESIEKLANVIKENGQERREEPIIGRITHATGFTSLQVEKIIHKKRVYDITFYTLFLLWSLYVGFGISQNTYFTNIMSIKEFSMKTSSAIFLTGILYLIYLIVWEIIKGPNYQLVHDLLKSYSG